MKKSLLISAALVLALSMAGCGGNNKNQADTGNNQSRDTVDVSQNYAEGASENVDMKKVDGEELQTSGDSSEASAILEQSAVSIEDAKLVDIDGKRCVIISYKFTNKGNEDASFSGVMSTEVYQDGMSVGKAIGDFDIEGFDSDSTAERIAPGKTITVQEIYNVVNDADIEVAVKEFHSEANVYVTQTFSIQ